MLTKPKRGAPNVAIINDGMFILWGVFGLGWVSSFYTFFKRYESYLGLDYSISIAYNGDSFDRYVIRFNEMIVFELMLILTNLAFQIECIKEMYLRFIW
jgi:NADH:ubiquinone oxidoreductase subunit D